MDLEECQRKGQIKRTIVNEELIRSLIEISSANETAVKTANITNVTISTYVSTSYDSLREILEAICISRGYKVLSHVCLGEILRDLLENFDYNAFDRFRYIRNGINYYGVKVEFDQGKQVIKKIFEMKNDLLKNHLKKFL